MFWDSRICWGIWGLQDLGALGVQGFGFAYFHQLADSEGHSVLHFDTWQRWQDTILQNVSWLLNCVLVQQPDRVAAAWVDGEAGVQNFILHDNLYLGLWDCVKRVRMLYSFWVVVINASEATHKTHSHVCERSSASFSECGSLRGYYGFLCSEGG